jgi:hypothetical protein
MTGCAEFCTFVYMLVCLLAAVGEWVSACALTLFFFFFFFYACESPVDCCVFFLNTRSVHGFPFFFFRIVFLCLIGETVFCFYTLYFCGSGGSVHVH